ncbi:unnamed protein product [Prunus armeniaca]|uniref:Secreted protein n=1 Tax=Prunus armeniaca TaxID=36596 RepID=A0A6J5XM65_PRUAR|nr:unnamed protein product [Prunus armeniaca]
MIQIRVAAALFPFLAPPLVTHVFTSLAIHSKSLFRCLYRQPTGEFGWQTHLAEALVVGNISRPWRPLGGSLYPSSPLPHFILEGRASVHGTPPTCFGSNSSGAKCLAMVLLWRVRREQLLFSNGYTPAADIQSCVPSTGRESGRDPLSPPPPGPRRFYMVSERLRPEVQPVRSVNGLHTVGESRPPAHAPFVCISPQLSGSPRLLLAFCAYASSSSPRVFSPPCAPRRPPRNPALRGLLVYRPPIHYIPSLCPAPCPILMMRRGSLVHDPRSHLLARPVPPC